MFGINIDDHFLCLASDLLSCCVQGKLPFKFLGIPVSANPRRCNTWDLIVLGMKKIPQSWRGGFYLLVEK